MDSEDPSLPSIVVPGPELREKIDKFAGRLSKREKRDADGMVAKVLASPKRNAFLFLDTSHIFYPYFLSKLSEYRQHPERAPDGSGGGKDDKEGGDGSKSATASPTPAASGATAATTSAGGASSPSSSSSTTTVRANGLVRTEGGTGAHRNDPAREALLRQTELEARRYLRDPFPNHYSLDLKAGTVDVPAQLMDVMACTAQYAAKYGESFVAAVQARQQRNPTFRFLASDDVRHGVFKGLVAAYTRILASNPEETEARFEALQAGEYVLGTVCDEKAKYARAALARRKAALLTDDELRAKLHWATFRAIKTFTLSDLMLDGPMPQRSKPPPAPVPVAAAAAQLAVNAEGNDYDYEDPSAAPPTSVPTTTTAMPNTILLPGGVPTFAPVFMSSGLVTSHADASSISNSNSSGGGKRKGGGGGGGGGGAGGPKIEILETYTPQAVAPVRRGVEFFVDTETGERFHAGEVASGGNSGADARRQQQQADLKRERESYGLATDDEIANELKRRVGEN